MNDMELISHSALVWGGVFNVLVGWLIGLLTGIIFMWPTKPKKED